MFFNGERLCEVEDGALVNAGKTGLWTKADSVTYFDEFAVTGSDSILPASPRRFTEGLFGEKDATPVVVDFALQRRRFQASQEQTLLHPRIPLWAQGGSL